MSNEKQIFAHTPIGSTEYSEQFVAENLGKIGKVLAVQLWPEEPDGMKIVDIIGERGTIRTDGYSWGGGATGQAALLKLLHDLGRTELDIGFLANLKGMVLPISIQIVPFEDEARKDQDTYDEQREQKDKGVKDALRRHDQGRESGAVGNKAGGF